MKQWNIEDLETKIEILSKEDQVEIKGGTVIIEDTGGL